MAQRSLVVVTRACDLYSGDAEDNVGETGAFWRQGASDQHQRCRSAQQGSVGGTVVMQLRTLCRCDVTASGKYLHVCDIQPRRAWAWTHAQAHLLVIFNGE